MCIGELIELSLSLNVHFASPFELRRVIIGYACDLEGLEGLMNHAANHGLSN